MLYTVGSKVQIVVNIKKHMSQIIWVYTVCKGKQDLETKEYNIFCKL